MRSLRHFAVTLGIVACLSCGMFFNIYIAVLIQNSKDIPFKESWGFSVFALILFIAVVWVDVREVYYQEGKA